MRAVLNAHAENIVDNFSIRTASELRQVAQDVLKQRAENPAGQYAPADTLKLLHELQIHQIELELQNQALLEAQQQIASNLELFKDLYDLAPVAYFTLDQAGHILKTNVLGKKLLGSPLNSPEGLLFSTFVVTESLDVFRAFLDRVFSRVVLENCSLTLISTAGGSGVHVQLEGVTDEAGVTCRLVVTDISDLINTQKKLATLEKWISETSAGQP